MSETPGVQRVAADRHADAIHDSRARVAGTALGVLFGFIGYPLSIMLGIASPWQVPFMVAVGVVTGYSMRRMISGISNLAGTAFGRMVLPTGRSSPYAQTYSREQSLDARGDLAGAIEAYDEAMRRNSLDAEPRLQAAELHVRHGLYARAAELFDEARRLAASDRAVELRTTQRLVDLFLGPLAAEGRALVELRRVVERFPGTAEAAAARAELARRKRGRVAGERPPQDGA